MLHIALEKKECDVLFFSIAVGCTLRRLVDNIAGFRVLENMTTLLAPHKLCYGIRGGAEVAVHAARRYLDELQSDHAIVKLDFKNAFNAVHRDKMLKAVEILAPTVYHFVHSVYSSPSSLVWGDKTISSSEGVQQGDPLGPLLFCLSIHHHCTFLSAEFCVMYLDDITLGGSMAEIGHDLEVIESLDEVELCLNTQKSEIICNNSDTRQAINIMLPGFRLIDPSNSSLLGSPLGDVDCISGALWEKISSLEVMGERLQQISAHDGIFLLRNSFSIPKLLYILRTSPCFLSSTLITYDYIFKSIVSNVTNILFGDDDPA